MSIQFQSDAFLDICIFSGVDVDYSRQAPRELTGEIAGRTLDQLQNSYNEYKNNLNLNYDEFLNKLKACLYQLKNPGLDSIFRTAVASKLTQLANERITQKENSFSWIHKIFHKIGQFFRGYGFRTKGTWGLELASRINKIESGIYKTRLKKAIQGALPNNKTRQIITEMQEKMNNLSGVEFKEALNDIIFKNDESYYIGKKNTYLFYSNLNEEKKQLFYQELLSRKDWFSQAFNIIEGISDHQTVESFITLEMVAKFQEDASKAIPIFFDKEKETRFANEFRKDFFQILVQKAVREYLRESSVEGYVKISSLFKEIDSQKSILYISEILRQPKILTDEEIQQLSENITLNQYRKPIRYG